MVTIRYFAAAQAAAGVGSETVEASSVSALVTRLSDAHGPTFAAVLGRCSLLVNGQQTAPDSHEPLAADALVDVLPPFAGG